MPEPTQSVRKALIPAAGRGTRMMPISGLIPKELVPLGSTPALKATIAEAAAAGIEEIGLIVRAEKPLIQTYLDSLKDDPIVGHVRFEYITQEVPLGLAEAIACGRPFLNEEPFALLLPDNFLPSPGHRLADLIAVHQATGADVIGVLELRHEDSGLYGNCGRINYQEGTHLKQPPLLAEDLLQRTLKLEELFDKGQGTLEIKPGETLRRTCGRYIFNPHLHDYTEVVRPTVESEFSEVPVVQHILREQKVPIYGYVLEGPLFDLGIPEGYLAASAWLHEKGVPDYL